MWNSKSTLGAYFEIYWLCTLTIWYKVFQQLLPFDMLSHKCYINSTTCNWEDECDISRCMLATIEFVPIESHQHFAEMPLWAYCDCSCREFSQRLWSHINPLSWTEYKVKVFLMFFTTLSILDGRALQKIFQHMKSHLCLGVRSVVACCIGPWHNVVDCIICCDQAVVGAVLGEFKHVFWHHIISNRFSIFEPIPRVDWVHLQNLKSQ